MYPIFEVFLPFPPSVNSMYGGGSGQRRFKTKKYKEWCASVPQLPKLNIDYQIRIVYSFVWPDNRARDGQNYIKAVTDTLVNEGVIKDDNWSIIISESWDYSFVDKKNSGVIVKIYKA